MPFISQEFTHIVESYDASPLYFNYKNPADNVTSSVELACLEASQLFFNDLKSLLEQTDLNVSFSENLQYESNEAIVIPSFKIWDLDLSPIVAQSYYNVNHITILPFILRHYSSAGINAYKKHDTSNSAANKETIAYKGRINKSPTEYEISYIIEIYYNTDFLIINYRPYDDKTIKFTLCCLIKGIDINEKVVIYESGGCNTYSATSNATILTNGFSWPAYHKLSWSESPYLNPYTGKEAYPTEKHLYPTNQATNLNASNIMFFDLCNNKNAVHDSGIQYLVESPHDVVLYKPFCCRGNVKFSNNILTGPMDLTLDTEYEVNGEMYYCPGDYTAIMESLNSDTYPTYSMRFLLKL